MSEENQQGKPVPPAPLVTEPAPGPAGGTQSDGRPEAAAEPAGVRSRNKIFKIAAIVFAALFTLLLGAVIFLYLKVSAFRDALLPPTETFQDAAFQSGEEGLPPGLPRAFRASPSSSPAPGGSALTVFTNAADYAPQGGGGLTLESGEEAVRALTKYADRPIVKEFMAELKKDPAFARALKQKDANNPMAMMASIQGSGNIKVLAAKFAMRRDFMPFLMEVMNDPEVRPLLGKLPPGTMAPMTQMLKMMPGAAGTAGPAAHKGKSRRQPVSRPSAPADEAADEEAGELPKVDTSVLDGSRSGAGYRRKAPSVPVEPE